MEESQGGALRTTSPGYRRRRRPVRPAPKPVGVRRQGERDPPGQPAEVAQPGAPAYSSGRAAAKGRTNAEIAVELHLSTGTVKGHLANIHRELQVRNRVEIAIWAHENGCT
ncbi:response regulator transcription factor [Plantactinospora sp. KLBMP9567]|uniref:response regulator transcription factor n=1 Tax=Plantactinospora sp. KLBMP9567 TaxID=3085900 RepID=UPI0029823CF1|nr:LuxR C-terminal-related transcriptional regulator [Plantactinospora sp. KLBMP9567]MDW5328011.1 LuxR C-terminal-related transcriptional regulator [Plantactinospora sp. KLBMP9567]